MIYTKKKPGKWKRKLNPSYNLIYTKVYEWTRKISLHYINIFFIYLACGLYVYIAKNKKFFEFRATLDF